MVGFLGIPDYFWHPLYGKGYQFWSGIGSDIGEVTIIGGLITIAVQIYRHRECHVEGCKKMGHMDPEVHAPACKIHHSHAHLRGKEVKLNG